MVKETTYQVTFNPDLHHHPIQDLRVELYNMFEELIDRGTADYGNRDMACIFINHPNLDQPIVVPPQPQEDMRPEDIMQVIENAIQSGKVLDICEGFQVSLGVARIERGGVNGVPITNVESDRISKRSLVSIENRDLLCFARALAVGMAKNAMLRRYQTMRDGDKKGKNSLQKRTAEEYHDLAGVPKDRPFSLLDVPIFEEALNVNIIIFAAHLTNKILYPDADEPKRGERVYLYYTMGDGAVGHFDCIVNIKGMLSR